MRNTAPATPLAFAALLAAALALPSCDGGTGYYRLAQRDGVWWFAAPDGEEMVSLGVNHIEPVLLAGEATRAVYEKRYGADLFAADEAGDVGSAAAARWMDDAMAQIRGWGFNTVGVHNPIPQRKMPYVAKFRPLPLDGWAKLDRRYADPFDPATRAYLDKAAAAWCAKNAEDPLILGVSFNDMPIWRATPLKIHEWVRFIMERGPESPGKRRWVEVLKRNYPGPVVAGAAYGVEAATWDDLLARTEWGDPRGPWMVYKDVNAFLPEIADAWYGAISGAIRTCDENHLIFGDKLEGEYDLPTWLYPIIGRHFDLAYLQWYATAAQQASKLAELNAVTGEPILMGDSSFSSPNDNVPRPKGVHVKTQKAVGKAYRRYLKAMMRTPYVVGWHFCGYIEGSADLDRFHPYFAIQSGFLAPDGTPHREAIAEVVAANGLAPKWHARAPRGDGKIWAYTGPRPGAKRCQHAERRFFSLSQVDNNVFNLEGVVVPTLKVPNKNIGWVITDEGVVVIDSGSVQSGLVAKSLIRYMTDKPIRYIIYTHHHGTQIGGVREIADPDTKVIAHEDLVIELDLMREMSRYHQRLNSIQFNLPLAKEEGPPPDFRYPDVTYKDEYSFTLGGTRFELRHVVGESDDYTVVTLPEQKIVWVTDLVGPSVPMVASPMKPVRNEVKWRLGLEAIRAGRPEVLVMSVGRPACDREWIDAKLGAVIDYLAFLHRAVARELNRGSTLEQARAAIRLPDDLAANPLLGNERYGSTDFNVRGVYARHSGWFDRDGTSLDPAPRAERGRAFVADMGGRGKVLARIGALEAARERALALEYVDLLLAIDPGDKEAHLVKGRLLRDLAPAYRDSPIMFNMYQRLAAFEEEAGRPE